MKESLSFFVIDDNDLDVEKIERRLKRMKTVNTTFRATDGYQALEMLRQSGVKQKLKNPFIILLDLNMPRMDGFEFLAELRKDEEYKGTPVVILTTSDRKLDIQTAQIFNVEDFIVKPIKEEDLTAIFERFKNSGRETENQLSNNVR